MDTLYANVVATIALVVSLGTAGWTIYRAVRWGRPVISVAGSSWVQGSSEQPSERKAGFSIEVTNTGDHATEIVGAYWELELGDNREYRVTGVKGNEPSPDDPHPMPRFPVQLDRFQQRRWEFAIPIRGSSRMFEEAERTRAVVEYVSRGSRGTSRGERTKRAATEWEPSQYRLWLESQRNSPARSE